MNNDCKFQQQRQTKPQLLSEVLDPSFHTIRPLKLSKKRKVWASVPIHQQLLHHMSAILRLGQIDDVVCWDSRTDFPEVTQTPDERGGGSAEFGLLTSELLKDGLPLLMAAKLKKALQHPHRVVSKRHLESGQQDENCTNVGTSYPRYLKCPEGQCVASVPKCQSHLTWPGQDSKTHLFRLPTNQIMKLHHQLFLGLCVTILSVDPKTAPLQELHRQSGLSSQTTSKVVQE